VFPRTPLQQGCPGIPEGERQQAWSSWPANVFPRNVHAARHELCVPHCFSWCVSGSDHHIYGHRMSYVMGVGEECRYYSCQRRCKQAPFSGAADEAGIMIALGAAKPCLRPHQRVRETKPDTHYVRTSTLACATSSFRSFSFPPCRLEAVRLKKLSLRIRQLC